MIDKTANGKTGSSYLNPSRQEFVGSCNFREPNGISQLFAAAAELTQYHPICRELIAGNDLTGGVKQ